MNSFIWDVEYFLNTSVVPKVKREKRPLLLKAYHEALVKNLEFYQYSGYIPTLEDVENESRRIEYGHFAISTFTPVMSSESTNALDMEKLMTHPPEEVIRREVFNASTVKENLGEDLKYFATVDLDTLWLARLLKESHHTSKPVEILETTVASAVPKGENYTSTVSRVKIRCLLASGLKKTFSIIVKTELKSEKAREIIENMPVFRSEIGVLISVDSVTSVAREQRPLGGLSVTTVWRYLSLLTGILARKIGLIIVLYIIILKLVSMCSEGMTPLHVAAVWGRRRVLQFLIEAGGDPNQIDSDGYSAFDYLIESVTASKDIGLISNNSLSMPNHPLLEKHRINLEISLEIAKIKDIWSRGLGVVCVTVFKNIPELEALTREACMINALSIGKLTNVVSGNTTHLQGWSLKSKRQLGVVLLYRAMMTLIAEGERQIFPNDLQKLVR
ncbi:unnamed protein product [Nesidiocoris tenuis]|uniref:Uncharacterized protein n=1 Tax=Nesidiocoris tenuis TaxID=355587 RepID=A0A6H5H4X1_9HEMI|nr:unnamed protein product [Nesidiocoris tenuis]